MLSASLCIYLTRTLRSAEAAAATEQARLASEKAEEEKDALRKEIVALHARLGSRRSRDGEEEGGNSLTEEPTGRHLQGVRFASSMRQENDASQQDRKSEMLSELLSDFNTQLANNYAQVRTALHQVPPAYTHAQHEVLRCKCRRYTRAFC